MDLSFAALELSTGIAAGSSHLGNPAGWATGIAVVGLAGYVWHIRGQAKLHAAQCARERRMREELEAYSQLDATLAHGANGRVDHAQAAKALAARVCKTIAEKSVFPRVLLMLRNAEGRLRCAGSIGVDDLTVAALERWGAEVVEQERSGSDAKASLTGRSGAKSFPIPLGEWQQFDRELSTWEMSGKRERRRWRRGIVLPVLTGAGGGLGAGRMAGAIVVCSDGLSLPDQGRGDAARRGVDHFMGPLETLAARLGRAMEHEALSERLLRAEKLAGLGQLAGGVAHALNNPLTAVLGYAELIAESSSEERVREDARTIAREALKMKSTIERLQDFWRPSTLADGPVDVLKLVRELAGAYSEEMSARGIKLEVLAAGEMETVRGCRARLGQVMEHLISNASQAIAQARAREEGEEHAIRISVSQDEHTLYVIFSDTGTGFREPGRAFDPFYTTQDPAEGAGLGLSICYGIVREHGGEIAAFNLHPHGAAVVVELPLGKTLKAEARVMVEEEQGVGDRV